MKYSKVMTIFTVVIVGLVFVVGLVVTKASHRGLDFVSTYFASEMLYEQRDIYDEPEIIERAASDGIDVMANANRFIYSPFLPTVLFPLTLLPVSVAVGWWQLINVIAFCGGLYLLIRLFPRPQRGAAAVALGAAALVCLPAWFSFFLGQVNGIIFLCLIAVLYFSRQKRFIVAGIILGLAIAIKTFPIIFIIYFLIKKRFILVGSAILFLAGIAFVALLMLGPFGISQYYEYVVTILPKITSGVEAIGGPTLPAISSSIIPSLNNAVMLGIVIVVFAAFFWFTRRAANRPEVLIIDFSILLALVLLLTHYTLYHYLMWMLLPIAIVFRSWLKSRHWLPALLLVGSIILLNAYPHTVRSVVSEVNGWWSPLVVYISFFGEACLIALLLYYRREKYFRKNYPAGNLLIGS